MCHENLKYSLILEYHFYIGLVANLRQVKNGLDQLSYDQEIKVFESLILFSCPWERDKFTYTQIHVWFNMKIKGGSSNVEYLQFTY